MRTGREEGLPSGDYDVTVTANEPPAATQSEGGGPPPPGKAITPVRYRSKATSGLSFVVEAGDNEINLELTSRASANADLAGARFGMTAEGAAEYDCVSMSRCNRGRTRPPMDVRNLTVPYL